MKARVGNNIEEIKTKLLALGCVLSDPIIQNDVTFVDGNYGQYEKFQPGKNVLRIRESNGKFLFTLKQPQSNELDAIERETEVKDPEEFKEALLLMGYKPVVEIHKTRVKTNFGDYEICIDEVEKLGSFIEVEKITDNENAELVQKELFDFLTSLGVDPQNRVLHGYDTLIYLQQN